MKKTFLLLLLLLHLSTAFSQTAQELPRVSITVSSLEKLVPFYETVLNFRKVDEYEWSGESLQRFCGLPEPDLKAKVVLLQLGNEQIELVEYLNEQRALPIPPDSRSNDLWFQHIAIVVKDMAAAYKKVRTAGVQFVSTAPQTLPDYLPAAAGISAFYFRDPDGHNLELIHFPKGKGNPKWQQPTDGLFLGIDHSAIGIEATDQSLGFYKNLLGLQVAGESENYGTEQEHLNQVFGAHLLITGLKAEQGYGLEFLDYLAPPGGRPYPADSRATDLLHWHTVFRVSGIEQVYRKLQEANYTVLSGGIIELRLPGRKSVKTFLVKDPDGHVVQVTE